MLFTFLKCREAIQTQEKANYTDYVEVTINVKSCLEIFRLEFSLKMMPSGIVKGDINKRNRLVKNNHYFMMQNIIHKLKILK